MKRINILMLALLAMTILIGGCEKDNFEPPHEWLTGRLTYQGNTFYLDGNSTNGDDELIQFFRKAGENTKGGRSVSKKTVRFLLSYSRVNIN